mgnify:CR=1 FL=1
MGVWVAAGIGVVSLIGGMVAAEEQADASNTSMIAQYNYNLMQETAQYGNALSASARQKAMKDIQNSVNYEALTRNYARQRLDLAKSVTDRRTILNKTQKAKNGALNSMITAKMGNASGSAEAIKRQMALQGKENWFNEFMNTANEKAALKTSYENNLNQSQDLSENLPPVILQVFLLRHKMLAVLLCGVPLTVVFKDYN